MTQKFLVSLIPVFLYLIMLLYLDSMKLVRKKLLMMCLGWGIISAGLCYFINTYLIGIFHIEFESYSMLFAPVVEEILKFSFLWVLIRRSKIGFMIDGAIYGFSIGAAFSFVENLYYLFAYSSDENNLMVWIIRGFGTAIMHGGATGIMGILCMSALNRKSNLTVSTLYGALAAIFIHGIYNRFLVSPLLSTLLMVIITPAAIIFIFNLNEKSIRNWLELEFDSEVNMLRMIKKGKFSDTKTGGYLISIKEHFQPEIVVDIYCYLTLYLELSMKAKSVLMMNEVGLSIPKDPALTDQLNELEALKKNIGRGGCMAISPVLKMSRKDLWKLSILRS